MVFIDNGNNDDDEDDRQRPTAYPTDKDGDNTKSHDQFKFNLEHICKV